jgi:hypothetical protein
LRRRLERSGVTGQSYFRWREEHGGLKELEHEKARLRRAVADLALDKLVLKEAASGNY